jgi:hypothetical protein
MNGNSSTKIKGGYDYKDGKTIIRNEEGEKRYI